MLGFADQRDARHRFAGERRQTQRLRADPFGPGAGLAGAAAADHQPGQPRLAVRREFGRPLMRMRENIPLCRARNPSSVLTHALQQEPTLARRPAAPVGAKARAGTRQGRGARRRHRLASPSPDRRAAASPRRASARDWPASGRGARPRCVAAVSDGLPPTMTSISDSSRSIARVTRSIKSRPVAGGGSSTRSTAVRLMRGLGRPCAGRRAVAAIAFAAASSSSITTGVSSARRGLRHCGLRATAAPRFLRCRGVPVLDGVSFEREATRPAAGFPCRLAGSRRTHEDQELPSSGPNAAGFLDWK